MRRSARTDSNQAAIVAAFRDLGCSVFTLHTVGRGFPDLAVGCNGLNLLIEVKDGSKCPSARRLTSDEQRFIEAWSGQVCIVSSVADVRLVVEGISDRARTDEYANFAKDVKGLSRKAKQQTKALFIISVFDKATGRTTQIICPDWKVSNWVNKISECPELSSKSLNSSNLTLNAHEVT